MGILFFFCGLIYIGFQCMKSQWKDDEYWYSGSGRIPGSPIVTDSKGQEYWKTKDTPVYMHRRDGYWWVYNKNTKKLIAKVRPKEWANYI